MQLTQQATDIDTAIDSIEHALSESLHYFDAISLNEGILGLSLFYYYYHQYTGQAKHLDKTADYLHEVFDKLSNGTVKRFDSRDLLGLGRCLCFYEKEGLISTEELGNSLGQINDQALALLATKSEKKDLDAIAGVLGIGHYLLDAGQFAPKGTIERIIDLIEGLAAYHEDGSAYWYFPLRDQANPIVEMGFYHGIAAVVYWLARAAHQGIMPSRCAQLAKAAMATLLSNKRASGINLFPFEMGKKEMLSYQTINYGDLGIGFALYKAGEVFGEAHFRNAGLEVLENTCEYRDPTRRNIRAAELVYGSTGLFAVLSSLYHETQMPCFEEAYQYWLNQSLAFNDRDTPWAGYETYYNGFDKDIQICFNHGICGIGIALINHKLNLGHEYLRFFNYKNL